MAIFNMIGGGGGGLIDAELILETTASYYGATAINIASTPQFDVTDTNYVIAVDIKLNGTTTNSRRLIRFIGLCGAECAGANTFHTTQTCPFGVVIMRDSYAPMVTCRMSNGFVIGSGGSTGFYLSSTSNYVYFDSSSTYTVKFYKIKLS